MRSSITLILCLCVGHLLAQESAVDREHGIFRLEIRDVGADDGKIFFIKKELATAKVDTVLVYQHQYDLGALKAWGKDLDEMPNVWTTFDYFATPVYGFDLEVIFMPDNGWEEMRILIENDTSYHDYNLSIPYKSGMYKFNLPDIKAQYYSAATIPYLARIKQRTWFKNPMHTKAPEQRFLHFTDVTPFEVAQFYGFDDYINNPPFAHYQLNWAQYSRQPNSFEEHSADHFPYPAYKKDGTPAEACVFNHFARGIRIRPYSDSSHTQLCQDEFPDLDVGSYMVYANRCDSSFRKTEHVLLELTYYGADGNTCLKPYYYTRNAAITYASDSLLSFELCLETHPLARERAEEILKLSEQIQAYDERYFEIKRKKPRQQARLLAKLNADSIFISESMGEEAHSMTHTLLYKYGYFSDYMHFWTFLNDTTFLHKANQPADTSIFQAIKYRSLVLNPYRPDKPVSLGDLFGPNCYAIIEEEMLALSKQAGVVSFNEHQYKAANKRQFMWGLEPGNLVIYYGNEGEFGALAKHKISFSKLLTDKQATLNFQR